MSVRSISHGRVCLLGDKLDLINRPVIAASISNGFTFDLEKNSKDEVVFEFPMLHKRFARPFGRQESDPFFKFLSQITWRLKDQISPFKCVISGDLPIGSGLSSSAACSVGLIRGLNKMFNLSMDNAAIAELAFSVERGDLGIACGRMDQYSVSFGGVTFIETGEQPRVTPIKVDKLPLVIGDSCEKRAAKSVLNKTMEQLDRKDPTFLHCFDVNYDGVLKGIEAIQTNNFNLLGKLMDRHMEMEIKMGASTQKLEEMCTAARRAGALGAKQIGAGGGGCMIALAPLNPEKVIEAVESCGGKAWIADISKPL